jgi:cell wall-associated NlpC family hydrolase/soluble lytic murein transglycosylase-like protein
MMGDALTAISDRIAAIQAQIQAVSPNSYAAPTGTAAGAASATDATATPSSAKAFATALDRAVQSGDASAGAPAGTAGGAPAASAVTDTAGVPDTGSAASGITGDDVVADAKKYLGVPYVWGGTSASGLDCSGLVQLTFKDLGIDLPRVSRDQAKAGTAVPSLADARPGDLVAFGSPVNHIAIYLGNNRILEAPQPGQQVHITEMYRTPVAIRRIVPAGDSSATADSTSTGTTAAPGVPASLLKVWGSAQVADVPRAVPLAALGMSSTNGAAFATQATTAPAAAPTGAGFTADQLTAAGLSGAVAAFAGDFAAAETKYNLPTGLLASVAQAESRGKTDAVSPAGAQGLMQLMPGTAAGLGVADPFNPQQAIDGAGKLLARNLDAFGGSLTSALAAYNAGAGAVRKYGGVPPYPATQAYVRSITDTLARLR